MINEIEQEGKAQPKTFLNDIPWPKPIYLPLHLFVLLSQTYFILCFLLPKVGSLYSFLAMSTLFVDLSWFFVLYSSI